MAQANHNLVVMIMAGGAGTRFWPLSTEGLPKQFVPIIGKKSLLQKSYERVCGIVPDERIFFLTNEQYTPLVRKQIPGVPPENIIGEPQRKDTAAAVCLGTLISQKQFGNPIMAVLTADHLIEPVELFQDTLLSAVKAAHKTGALYTFGIKPSYPATGYGYLELGNKVKSDDNIEHFSISSFKEKPEKSIARKYVDSGRYLWNSGMFVWTVEAIYSQMKQHIPAHLHLLREAVKHYPSSSWERSLRSCFAQLSQISIDFAVMEKARDVRAVVGTFSWKDVGGWLAMKDLLPSDTHNNHQRGRVHTLNAQDNIIYSKNEQETIALLGIKDIIVVRAGDKTLVAHKDYLEEIKQLVQNMRNKD